jgi:hypothetical protein
MLIPQLIELVQNRYHNWSAKPSRWNTEKSGSQETLNALLHLMCCRREIHWTPGDGNKCFRPISRTKAERSIRRRWSVELVAIPSSVQTQERVKSYEVPAGAYVPHKVTSLVLILRVMLAEQKPIRCGRTHRGFRKLCVSRLRPGPNSLDSPQGPALPSTCTAGSGNLSEPPTHAAMATRPHGPT